MELSPSLRRGHPVQAAATDARGVSYVVKVHAGNLSPRSPLHLGWRSGRVREGVSQEEGLHQRPETLKSGADVRLAEDLDLRKRRRNH